MIEKFESSRFLIREKPIAYPHYDLILQDSQGPVFDLGVDMDSYDGSVYLHVDHVIEMGRTLGMATKEEVAALEAINADLQRQINKLPTAQEELKRGIDDSVASFYASLNTDDKPAVPDVPSDPKPKRDNSRTAETEREADGPLVL